MHDSSTARFHMVLFVAAFFAFNVEAQSASFQTLGSLEGGGSGSSAWGISGDGSVVVGRANSSAGVEAFIWDADRGMRGLGDLAGGDVSSWARGVSDDGSRVVGFAEDEFGATGFVWDELEGMQPLEDLEGARIESAKDISGDGKTIVGQLSTEDAFLAGFVWSAEDGYRVPNPTNQGGQPTGRAVSRDGTRSVGSSGALFDTADGIRILDGLPGSSSFAAFDISTDGSTVVGFSRSGPDVQGFIWDEENGTRGLGQSIDGEPFRNEANAVSGDGSIVVGRGDTEAFIWDEENGMRSLTAYLMALGLDLEGWTIERADALSDDGRTIVGTARRGGTREAFIAVVPEAGTGMLLGLGLAVLGMAGRDRTGR